MNEAKLNFKVETKERIPNIILQQWTVCTPVHFFFSFSFFFSFFPSLLLCFFPSFFLSCFHFTIFFSFPTSLLLLSFLFSCFLSFFISFFLCFSLSYFNSRFLFSSLCFIDYPVALFRCVLGISIRGSVRPSVRPSICNAFSHTPARRILCRVFGLVHLLSFLSILYSSSVFLFLSQFNAFIHLFRDSLFSSLSY